MALTAADIGRNLLEMIDSAGIRQRMRRAMHGLARPDAARAQAAQHGIEALSVEEKVELRQSHMRENGGTLGSAADLTGAEAVAARAAELIAEVGGAAHQHGARGNQASGSTTSCRLRRPWRQVSGNGAWVPNRAA